MTGRWAALASAAALTLLAAGCSAAGAPAAALPAASPLASVPALSPASAARARYPIEAYLLSDAQQAELTVAGEDMVSGCMHRLGFNYEPLKQRRAQFYKEMMRDQAESHSRIWGISDLQVAEKYGYGLPAWYSGSPGATAPRSFPAAEMLALNGAVQMGNGTLRKPPPHSRIPPGGCQHQAIEELATYGFGPSGPGQALVSEINLQSFREARGSAQVKRVFAEWSACMESHGYRYPDPFAAAASFASAQSVTPRQVQVAVTDIGCARKVNVLGVAFAVDSAYQRQMIHRYASQLAQVRTRLHRQSVALAMLLRQHGAG